MEINFNHPNIYQVDLARGSIKGQEVLGKGVMGSVYTHIDNPAWVVKESTNPYANKNAFRIASILDHKHILKVHTLVLDKQTLGDQAVDKIRSLIGLHPMPIRSELTMDRITKPELHQSYGTGVKDTVIIDLVKQAQKAADYVLEKGVFWADLHGKNVYVDPTEEQPQITIADFDFWKRHKAQTFSKKEVHEFFAETQHLVGNLIGTGNGMTVEDKHMNEHAPGLAYKYDHIDNDAYLTDKAISIVTLDGTLPKGEVTRNNMREFISTYFDSVIKKYNQRYL